MSGFRFRQLEVGQLIYVGVALSLLLAAVLCMPFTNPLTDEVHWSLVWAPPRYQLEQMDKILTQETIAKVKENITVSDDFRKNSTTAEMRPQISLYRKIVLITLAIIVVGWFFVPAWINRRFHHAAR